MSGDLDSWNPERELGLDRPHPARICDHLLGGAHGFAVDRQAATELVAAVPEIVEATRATRRFATWAIHLALDRGIRQFVDLGSGLPPTSCHNTLHLANPHARAVLVDRDMVVATYLERHLVGVPRRAVAQCDLCRVDQVFEYGLGLGVLDPQLPLGILATGVLHLVSDQVGEAMAAYRRAAAPGSVLAITHAGILDDPDRIEALAEVHAQAGSPWCPRGPEIVGGLLGGWEPLHPPGVEPGVGGLVSLAAWGHAAGGVGSAGVAPFLDCHLAGVAVRPPTHRGDSGSRIPGPRTPVRRCRSRPAVRSRLLSTSDASPWR